MAKRRARPPLVTAGDAVRGALAASVRRLKANEPGIKHGREPEAIHQARVAVRRLRSDLKSFRPFVDREWADGLRQELRWLGGELGAVRDLDVLLARLRSDARRADAAAGTDDPGLQLLFSRFRAERSAARKVLLDGIGSPRYRALRERLAQAASDPDLTVAARMPAADGLTPIVKRRWKRLRAAVEALPRRPAARALHRIRILAKRCRYAAEGAIDVIGPEAKTFSDAAAALQNALGELNDAEVARAKLRRCARDVHMTIAARNLLALETNASAIARRDWPIAWRALDDKRLRSWL
ncbi:MAG TPA: CHAD domain-containing protein [Candidatus Eremiobacteraceae bacterium]|nr:CHAD domain-containing protein [Candidatus Eremiobacteraceae bacterium]